MSSDHFVVTYVQVCASGKLPLTECGPVWQIAIIAGLLTCAIMALVVLRLRPSTPTVQG
jgi:hypothetical protein